MAERGRWKFGKCMQLKCTPSKIVKYFFAPARPQFICIEILPLQPTSMHLILLILLFSGRKENDHSFRISSCDYTRSWFSINPLFLSNLLEGFGGCECVVSTITNPQSSQSTNKICSTELWISPAAQEIVWKFSVPKMSMLF